MLRPRLIPPVCIHKCVQVLGYDSLQRRRIVLAILHSVKPDNDDEHSYHRPHKLHDCVVGRVANRAKPFENKGV